MAELKIQPHVARFVEDEYGEHGVKVLKTAVTDLAEQLRWARSASEVRQRMDGSFSVDGANIFKKYVNGPQQAWRTAIKRIGDDIYAVEMFAAKKDEDVLIRNLEERF